VVKRVVNVDMTLFSSRGWESGCPWRVTGDGGVNSILQFQLEMGGDGMKCYRKMKQRHRAHLGSMGRKRDTVRRRGDISQRRGGIEVEKGKRRY
jgi:hypothetical protein